MRKFLRKFRYFFLDIFIFFIYFYYIFKKQLKQKILKIKFYIVLKAKNLFNFYIIKKGQKIIFKFFFIFFKYLYISYKNIFPSFFNFIKYLLFIIFLRFSYIYKIHSYFFLLKFYFWKLYFLIVKKFKNYFIFTILYFLIFLFLKFIYIFYVFFFSLTVGAIFTRIAKWYLWHQFLITLPTFLSMMYFPILFVWIIAYKSFRDIMYTARWDYILMTYTMWVNAIWHSRVWIQTWYDWWWEFKILLYLYNLFISTFF